MITSVQCYKKWGDPLTTFDEGSYMTLWRVPEYVWKHIPTIPRRIYCNEQMIIPLEVAFLDVINQGLTDKIVTWDGCFQVRPIRGYAHIFKRFMNRGQFEAAMRYLSIHSWGCAIDINQATNGLGKVPTMSKDLVKCFKDAGFDWGGEWKRPDGMHFQLTYLT